MGDGVLSMLQEEPLPVSEHASLSRGEKVPKLEMENDEREVIDSASL